MKNIIFVITLLFTASTSFAGSPPAQVQSAFDKKFPNSTNVKWGKENSKEWEADFKFDGKKLSANFLEDGTWIETEQEITIAQFPTAVSQAIAKTYPGWKITEADKTDTAKNGLIYEADIKNNSQKKEVAYKANGTPVVE
jgi:hypothetical protein